MTNKAAAELGRKGGKARVKNMTPEQLSAANRKAALARWSKKKKTP
jgi:hypothetical protein